MNYKVRRISSDKDQASLPARAYSGPESVGIEWDENSGEKCMVLQPGTTEDDRRRVLSREMADVSVWQDDFLGDIIDAKYTLLSGSDAQAVNPVIQAGVKCGAVDLTSGNDGTTTMAVNGSQLVLGLNYSASVAKSRIFMEAYLEIDAITNVVLYVGFTDSIALEMPFTISGTTLTSNATDAVGFVFDTNQTTDRFYAVGVDSNTDATHELLDTAPVAGTKIRLGVQLRKGSAGGEADFFINGVKKGNTMLSACTPGALLTPTIAVFSETTTSRVVTMDYWYASQARV